MSVCIDGPLLEGRFSGLGLPVSIRDSDTKESDASHNWLVFPGGLGSALEHFPGGVM